MKSDATTRVLGWQPNCSIANVVLVQTLLEFEASGMTEVNPSER